MKAHILIAVFALAVSACASKRDIASTPAHEQEANAAQHAQMIDGQASRIR
jgi:hypothetical protein